MHALLERHRYKQRQTGFTIVELLIVVVVIAILAAIIIVSYNGITKQAAIADLQNEAQSVVNQIATQSALDGSYPALASAMNGGDGLKYGSNKKVEYTSTGTAYCVTISSSLAKASLMYDSTTGATTEGVCPGHTGYVDGGDDSFAWTAVSAGGTNTCGISDGKLYCWGAGTSTPTLVGGVLSGKTVTAVSAGQSFSCAVADGRAYCWGNNGSGALGTGNTDDSEDPVAVVTSGVLSGKTIQSVSVGGNHTCALTSDGVMACWGQNNNGQLGTGNTSDRTSPTALSYSDGSGWTSPLAGKTITAITTGYGHTCVIASGLAYCWGANERSQLGFNSTYASYVPGAVTASGVLNGLTINKIAAGYAHTCVVASNSRTYCWQTTQYTTTLNGTGTTSNVPVAVSTSGVLNGKNIVATAGSNSANCVADSAGKVYCWGSNSSGQLGNNSGSDSYVPVAVIDSGALSGKTITALASGGAYGGSYTCGLAGGEIYCWGVNSSGELGDGTTTNRSTPVQVIHP